jgi:hypothetical protein
MHRSSETVAAIATALAKAQTDLTNPEKAMIGSIYNSQTDSQQSSRYPSAESVTATSIAMEMKSHGGSDGRSIRSRRPGCFGSQRGASTEKADADYEIAAHLAT